MWQAYLKLETYHEKPSDVLEITDSIVAWCVDSTVLWFGITVKNLLGERVKVGSGKDEKYEAKYELEQLLDPTFRVEREMPKPKQAPVNTFAAMMALAGQPGVKAYQYVKPS